MFIFKWFIFKETPKLSAASSTIKIDFFLQIFLAYQKKLQNLTNVELLML